MYTASVAVLIVYSSTSGTSICICGAPTGAVYSAYLRALRELTSVVQGTEKVKPSDTMAFEVVRTSVSRQYPTLTPALYPGELITAVEPFPSVTAMLVAHDVYATNNIR